MNNLKDLKGIHKGRNIVIIGAGGTLKHYGERVKEYLLKNDCITIGINNMTSFIVPNYHLWTNTRRLENYGNSISKDSIVLISSKIRKDLSNRWNHLSIDYEDNERMPISYNNGKITGYFRTAGCLAIMIANIMGASRIDIVGMDGYTYYPKEDLDNNANGQHLYGSGMTDNNDWDVCLKKDEIVLNVLRSINKFGVKFSILTPTKFEEFYDGSRI